MTPARKNPQVENSGYSALLATIQAMNALVEHQGVFTHAEFRLATIIVRRGGHREPVVVSDSNWQSWTHLDAKSRYLALKGLKAKGFSIDGRGDTARIGFNPSKLRDYAAALPDATIKPQVQQVRSVPAKPGTTLHPECAERGCQKLCAEKQECEVIAIDSARDLAASKPADMPEKTEEGGKFQNKKLHRESGACGGSTAPLKNWPRTLETMRLRFLSAGESLLKTLLGKLPDDTTDAELAYAVAAATVENQKSPALWLTTVPDAFANLRRMEAARSCQRAPVESPNETPQQKAEREEFERWYTANHPSPVQA